MVNPTLCSSWTQPDARGWSHQCSRPAHFLFVREVPTLATDQVTRNEALCRQHAAHLLGAPALPGNVIGIAVWCPAKSERGWYWP